LNKLSLFEQTQPWVVFLGAAQSAAKGGLK
jgi:hypothetical protein